MKRNIDALGRIVIPVEIRKQLDINNGDSVDIDLVDNKIVISNPSEIDYKQVVKELKEWLEDMINDIKDDNACERTNFQQGSLITLESTLAQVEFLERGKDEKEN